LQPNVSVSVVVEGEQPPPVQAQVVTERVRLPVVAQGLP
jgi:hypothetical protein